MEERHLLRQFRQYRNAANRSHVKLGIGDDCAIFAAERDGLLATSTDMLIESVHFVSGTDPDLVGHKAVARALSDLAAMACRPVACLAAISFPGSTSDRTAGELCDAISDAGQEMGAPLIGGDVGAGTSQLVITVTVFGVPGPGGYIPRSGARDADGIYVTGRLGGAVESGRHLTFSPRLEVALSLSEHLDIHAMIDISDGLSTDLHNLCEASDVGATIQADTVPIHPDLKEEYGPGESGRENLVRRALSDGEDYELLLCLPPEQSSAPIMILTDDGVYPQGEREAVKAHESKGAEGEDHDLIILTRIGTCKNEGYMLEWNEPEHKQEQLEAKGWEHRT